MTRPHARILATAVDRFLSPSRAESKTARGALFEIVQALPVALPNEPNPKDRIYRALHALAGLAALDFSDAPVWREQLRRMMRELSEALWAFAKSEPEVEPARWVGN